MRVKGTFQSRQEREWPRLQKVGWNDRSSRTRKKRPRRAEWTKLCLERQWRRRRSGSVEERPDDDDNESIWCECRAEERGGKGTRKGEGKYRRKRHALAACFACKWQPEATQQQPSRLRQKSTAAREARGAARRRNRRSCSARRAASAATRGAMQGRQPGRQEEKKPGGISQKGLNF